MSQALGAQSKTITGSQLLLTGRGEVYGFIVNSHTTGSIRIWDSITATGRVLIDTFAYPTGASTQRFPAPLHLFTGMYVELTGVQSVTVVFNQN